MDLTYNARNQQVGYTAGLTSASYTYSPDGLRRTKTTTGMPDTQYVWSGGMMVYECELLNPASGTVHVYGINLISSRSTSGNKRYYLYNAHGDVVQLLNSTKTLVKSYKYDAFGVEYNIDPNDPNPFRYCGEYFDKETGTYYLRARYYNPANGRFTSADTHWNVANMIYGDNPVKINERKDHLDLNIYTYIPNKNAIQQSGNLYVYGVNNPVNYIDTEGKFIISTAALLIGGGALLFGAIGGFMGNKAAKENGAEGWDKARYIVSGVAIGGALGAVVGAVAAPAVVSATGIAGISVTATGVTAVTTGVGLLIPEFINNAGSFISWLQQTFEKSHQVLDLKQTKQLVELAKKYNVNFSLDELGHPGTSWDGPHLHFGNIRIHVNIVPEAIKWIFDQIN